MAKVAGPRTANERCFLREKACCPGNQAALPHPQESAGLWSTMWVWLERGPMRTGQGLVPPCDSAVGTPPPINLFLSTGPHTRDRGSRRQASAPRHSEPFKRGAA